MGYITSEQWEFIKTLLAVIGGIYALLERPLSWMYNKINKKLIVEIENKAWKHGGIVGSGKYKMRWDVDFKFNNKLGKYTVVDKIQLEYNEDKKINVLASIKLMPDDVERYRHNFEVGENVFRILGELVISHSHGTIEIPIDECYSGELENMDKDVITASTAKRNR